MSKVGDENLFDGTELEFIDINDSGELIGGEASSQNNGEEESGTQATTTTEDNPELIDINTSSPTESGDNSETDNQDSIDTDSATSSQSPFSSIATALGAEGYYEFDEEEFKKYDNPADYIRDNLDKYVEEKLKNSLSEEEKEAFEAYKQGVPLKNFVNSKARQTQYENVRTTDIEANEKLQATLVLNSEMMKGRSREEAEDLVKTYQDVGEDKLKQKALEAHTYLVAGEKALRDQMVKQAEEQRLQAEQDEKENLKNLQDYINKQGNIIDGIELTDKTKEDLYKLMTTPVKAETNEPVNKIGKLRLEDPKSFDLKLAYYVSIGLFDEKPDISKISKLAETKVAKGLDALASNTSTSFIGGGGSKSSGGASSGNYEDAFIVK